MPTEEQINHLRHAVGHDPEAERTLEQLLALVEPPEASQKPHAQAEALREQARVTLDNRAMKPGPAWFEDVYPSYDDRSKAIEAGEAIELLVLALFPEFKGCNWVWEWKSGSDSHWTFTREGMQPITVRLLSGGYTAEQDDKASSSYSEASHALLCLKAMTDASQALAAAREFQANREFWIKPMEDANLE